MNSRKIYFNIFLIRYNYKSGFRKSESRYKKQRSLVESNKPNAKIGNLNPSTSA